MRRIFIIQNTPINEPLPLSVYLTSLLKNFEKKDNIEINLIVSKSKKIPVEISNLCNKIYQIDSSTYSIYGNVYFGFKTQFILRLENKRNGISILHCFYPNSSLMGAVPFKILNRRVKIIYDVRSPWIEMSIERGFVNRKITKLYKVVLYLFEKFFCRFVGHFIFITEGLAKYYKNKLNIKENQKVTISPSGVDLKLFRKVKSDIRKKYGIKDDETLIGSVGGIAKIRRLDQFLEIFKKATESNQKIKLMFVGNGDAFADLRQKSKRMINGI